jgi:hypothetical protein
MLAKQTTTRQKKSVNRKKKCGGKSNNAVLGGKRAEASPEWQAVFQQKCVTCSKVSSS